MHVCSLFIFSLIFQLIFIYFEKIRSLLKEDLSDSLQRLLVSAKMKDQCGLALWCLFADSVLKVPTGESFADGYISPAC